MSLATAIAPAQRASLGSETEREERGDKEIEIVRLKITDAGRRAL
jgi:hypothetical protein